MSLLRGSAGWAGSPLDQSCRGVFRPLFKHIPSWKPLLASCHLCIPESTAMVLTGPSPSVPVLPGVRIVLGPPAPGRCQQSVTGLLSSLGHSHASGSAQDNRWNQLPPGTAAGTQWGKEHGSINTSTCATSGRCHLRGWWPRQIHVPASHKSLCICARGPPGWLALQDCSADSDLWGPDRAAEGEQAL